jgi:hypothetical protein
MFFKCAVVPTPQQFVPTIPWDEKAVEYFAKSDRFDVHITTITKRFGFGMTKDKNEICRDWNRRH